MVKVPIYPIPFPPVDMQLLEMFPLHLMIVLVVWSFAFSHRPHRFDPMVSMFCHTPNDIHRVRYAINSFPIPVNQINYHEKKQEI